MASTGNWSTERIESLLREYNATGIMPRNNPFYMGKTDYRDADINYSYTKEEFLEMAKCKRNILRFSETKARVMTDQGIKNIKLRDYQKEVLLQFNKFRFNVFVASRQIGKCVTFDTNVTMIIDDKEIEIPIYKLFYSSIDNPIIWDKIELLLYGWMYKLQKWISKIETKIEN